MRLDIYLVTKYNLTRSKSVDLIKRGFVIVNDKAVTKQAYNVKELDKVVLASNFKYVSRGGYKLESFIKKTNVDFAGKIILDIGCSNGGFSHFFLQNGIKKIVAVDIGYNILDRSLQKDEKVVFIDKFDATNKKDFDNLPVQKFDIISVDLTGVKLNKVLLFLPNFLNSGGQIIALFKPHYEGGKGIVSKQKLDKLLSTFEEWTLKYFVILKKARSELRGGSKSSGNIEWFYLLKPK